jgi:FkbM family methyltransferase
MQQLARRLLKTLLPPPLRLRLQVRRALRGGSEVEIRLLPLLARGGAFIDVGANVGGWSGPACRSFRQVHAFEPYAELADALRRAAPANMQVHPLALSDRTGSAAFSIPLHGGITLPTRASLEAQANVGFEQLARQVELATLDSLQLDAIDAIKIDVEGHEEAVLNGAWQTIESQRPSLIVEIEERHHPGRSEVIIARIVALGYRCHFVRDGRLHPYAAGSIGALQPASRVPAPGQQAVGYINNFIFSPHERDAEVQAMRDRLAGDGAAGA